jgi:hypothetical protein
MLVLAYKYDSYNGEWHDRSALAKGLFHASLLQPLLASIKVNDFFLPPPPIRVKKEEEEVEDGGVASSNN